MPVYEKQFKHGTHAQRPAAGIAGRLYYCSTHGALYRDNGVSWDTCTITAEAVPGPHAADHQPGGADAMAVDAAAGTGSLRTLGTGAQQAAAGNHTHPGGSGAPFVYLPLLSHFTTLENTTSANATWKIPAATTYGQSAVYLDMSKAGSPVSAVFVACYTNTATTGTNQIGLRFGAAPVAAGTTVTPLASSVVTLANSSTYPQTFVKALTVSELGSTAQWVQIALNLATSTVGPNLMSAGVVLYY